MLQELAIGGAHARAIGSAKTVADELQRWVEVGGLDGFNFAHVVSPGTFEDMIKWLWPELKARGVMWDDYDNGEGSMREGYARDGKGPGLREDHPGAKFTWKKE